MDAVGTKGILVGDVLAGTPAEKGGLQTGDIITELDGKSVTDVNDFRIRVADQKVGETIHLDVMRDGKKKSLAIVLEERPDTVVASAPGGGPKEWAGLTVDDVDSARAQRLPNLRGEEGVLVVGVEPGSAADDAGIQAGDIIKELGNMEIADTGDYAAAVQKYQDKKAVAILLKRGNQTLYVGVKP
jgi:serine protease Do